MSIPTYRSHFELKPKATISLLVRLCKEPIMPAYESACIAAISSARIANATALCDELCLRRFASI